MNNKELAKKVFTHPVYFLAFGFGSGLSPKAPGTMGTLASLPVIILAFYYHFPLWMMFVVTLLVGTFVAHKVSQDLGVDDYPGIVIDEFAGMMLTLMFVPLSWVSIALGFVLFRIFDIWKPWPIRQLDLKVKGGVGVMLDDLVAALYAGASLWVIILILSHLFK